MYTFDDHLINNPGSGIVTASDPEIQSELQRRSLSNPYPLDVFNDKIKPYINLLNKYGDIPPSYIGTALLNAYSTAIGTSYALQLGGTDLIYLPIWSVLVGISSAGKSYILNKINAPLRAIQAEYDVEWNELTANLTNDQINKCQLKTLIFRDIHMPTLLKSVLPDNPKGLLKEVDEVIEWINGMNQLSSKEGIDEQAWLSSWNCIHYSGIRSGKQKFVVPRPFINVLGGTQYSKLYKLLGNNRDSSGFTFRILFAVPEIVKIADVDPEFQMPKEFSDAHAKAIFRLYKELPIENGYETPRKVIMTPSAVKLFTEWYRQKQKTINGIRDTDQLEIQSGIFGKIKEYTMRFVAILHLANQAYTGEFKMIEYINDETMCKAIRLAEYYFKSAVNVFDFAQDTQTAPPNVLISAKLLGLGKSYSDIAEVLYNKRDDKHRMRATRDIKGWIKKYPRVFNAIAK